MIDYIIGGIIGATIVLSVGGIYTYHLMEKKDDLILHYRLEAIELASIKMQIRSGIVGDMHTICSNVNSRKRLLTKRMEALYDAGYRKVNVRGGE